MHGSALFERGETQILGVTTLNMLRMEQQLDTLSPDNRKRYMHNYNFPPYSTGETGRVGSPKRREIGHGALGVARCGQRVRGARPERGDVPEDADRASGGLDPEREPAQGDHEQQGEDGEVGADDLEARNAGT